jgi:hypothetical protein
MVRCRGLYKAQRRQPRARLELERDILRICLPDGRWRPLFLNGARFAVRDAARGRRFVRHLKLYLTDGRADLITPPDEGAIAPRAAQLPGVPDGAITVDRDGFEAVADWLQGGGRLGGRTVAELARLASIASAQFAITLGEWAAQVAMEMTWDRRGPLRGGSDLRHPLRPLEEAANRHPRAAEALVAALSRSSRFRRAG